MNRIVPLNRLLLRYFSGRWHLGISLRGQRVVEVCDARGDVVANLLPLATKAESDSWQTQLAEAYD